MREASDRQGRGVMEWRPLTNKRKRVGGGGGGWRGQKSGCEALGQCGE